MDWIFVPTTKTVGRFPNYKTTTQNKHMEVNDKPVEFSGTLSDLGDMSGISTKYPVLDAGLQKMKIKSFKRDDKPNKKTGNPQSMLLIELATEDFAKQYQKPDADIAPGHVITERIILTPTGGLTQEMIQQRLARVMEAALGHHNGAFNTADLLGKVVTVNIGIRPEREEDGRTFDASNEIKKWIPLTV